MKKKAIAIFLFISIIGGGVFYTYALSKQVHILMILWRGQGESNAESGFKECLKSQLKHEITYTVKDVATRREDLSRLINETDFSTYDLIYTYGTMVSRIVAKKIKDKPIVFNIVTDPVGDGIVISEKEPGFNVTGASNSVSIEHQIKKMHDLFGMKDIAIIYNPLDTRIMSFVDEMRAYVQKRSVELKEFKFTKEYNDYRRFEKFLDEMKGKISCIYLPTDRLIVQCAQALVQKIQEKNIPSCATNDAYLRYGALLSMTSTYYDVGWIAGMKAVKILEGANPGKIPVERVPESKIIIKINRLSLKSLGITLPPHFEKENTIRWM
ncbi:MAG: ABC transporter substrate-binding protein [bacterium]